MKRGEEIRPEKVLGYRLGAHHLDRPLPPAQLLCAAGACGLQNTPPGAWETAAFNRVEGCTLDLLEEALYEKKSLLQAWSFRGAPVVFPTGESDIFLTPLRAQQGEWPWIYTRGIALALDHLGMSFDELLGLALRAAGLLDGCTIRSKEELDRALAQQIAPCLPAEKRALWEDPSMYGSPDRQTVGGAVVSFLLRPCSFFGLVVFGRREGASPTFTSFARWTGQKMPRLPQPEKELVRRFLRCYGPSTLDAFTNWLGSCPAQARRLWDGVAEEMEQVLVEGKKRYLLASELEALRQAQPGGGIRLLGAHDPYLDLRDRALILPDVPRQRIVWRTVANPGVILRDGRVAGIWKTKTAGGKLSVAHQLFEPLPPEQRRALKEETERYAAFRRCRLTGCAVEEA